MKSKPQPTGARTAVENEAPPPPVARASTFTLGEDELVVVSVELEAHESEGRLSTAEREVAILAVTGSSNEEIARTRGTSVRTVANQLASTFQKLGVHSRFELAACLAGEGSEDSKND